MSAIPLQRSTFALMPKLHIKTFTFNPFQENTYLIYNDEKETLIVDPGMYFPNEFEQFFNFIDGHGLKPTTLLNTHCHIDHVVGIPAVMQRYNIPYFFNKQERPVFDRIPETAKMFGLRNEPMPEPSGYLAAGDTVRLGKEQFSVLFTPGHSPGSLCFYHEADAFIISGDVLFQQSIGRTDLPGGHYDTLIHSITTQLMPLPENVTVYSGHGPATTIGLEKMNNPFLRR